MIALLQLMRAPAVFTAVANILAAHLIATSGEVQWVQLIVLMFASAALYCAGMVLNDCFDFHADALERPERPLPSGRVPLNTAWSLGWTLLISGLLLAAVAGRVPLLIATSLAAAIVLYNAFAKHTPLASVAMGGCRYLNWLLGLSVLPLDFTSLVIALPVFFYVVSLTTLSQAEADAADISRVRLSASGMFITALCIVLLINTGVLPNLWAVAPAIAGLFWVMRLHYQIWNDFKPANVQRGVGLLIFSIVPLDALLVLAAGHWWGALAVLALMLPGRLLGRYMYIT